MKLFSKYVHDLEGNIEKLAAVNLRITESGKMSQKILIKAKNEGRESIDAVAFGLFLR